MEPEKMHRVRNHVHLSYINLWSEQQKILISLMIICGYHATAIQIAHGFIFVIWLKMVLWGIYSVIRVE